MPKALRRDRAETGVSGQQLGSAEKAKKGGNPIGLKKVLKKRPVNLVRRRSRAPLQFRHKLSAMQILSLRNLASVPEDSHRRRNNHNQQRFETVGQPAIFASFGAIPTKFPNSSTDRTRSNPPPFGAEIFGISREMSRVERLSAASHQRGAQCRPTPVPRSTFRRICRQSTEIGHLPVVDFTGG